MRNITSIAVSAVAASTAPALREAHRQAAAFHAAMADAIGYREDIDAGGDEPGEPCDPYWVEAYQGAMGRAAAALQAMPVTWAAVLNLAVPAVPISAGRG